MQCGFKVEFPALLTGFVSDRNGSRTALLTVLLSHRFWLALGTWASFLPQAGCEVSEGQPLLF